MLLLIVWEKVSFIGIKASAFAAFFIGFQTNITKDVLDNCNIPKHKDSG
jgi:hypothetical protein